MQVYLRVLLLGIITGTTMGAVAASITPTTKEGLARYECNHMTVFQKPSLLNGPDACKYYGGMK
ncbi:hypothetical protein SAMN05444141_102512 [Pseudovibrio denitrificans]|uniref:YARHG domain-containing protein n=2 Tax=Pseudovibrio TaxID=258255 RepID=A0A1I6ZPX4_9HYPH|nr:MULTISPECIES: hypothetical protein [Pseudovibrio]QUS54712.1 hypothetical protein KGB56_15130 [Pseudovibrio brasiliensis]SFT64635.1 hypothetical protein SAMN05444141_102512 [Pseudovibrio denitrificans]